MISEVLTVIAPVFIIAGLGYFWVKRELPFDNATISSLVMYVGSPCLIYSALTSNAAETTALGTMGASAFLVILMSLIFSWASSLAYLIDCLTPSLILSSSPITPIQVKNGSLLLILSSNISERAVWPSPTKLF